MAIDVSKEFERELEERVRRGPYRSVEEFLRKSIERADAFRAQLRAAIDEGTLQARRGDFVDGDEFFDTLDAELRPDDQRA